MVVMGFMFELFSLGGELGNYTASRLASRCHHQYRRRGEIEAHQVATPLTCTH